MFDNWVDILVLIVILAGWAIFFYLVIGLIRSSRERKTAVSPAKRVDAALAPGVELPVSSTGKAMEILAPAQDGVLLSIEVPKENETTPLAAELMFSSLHGIYKPELERSKGAVQDTISFEIQAQEKAIRFFVWTPRYLQGYVEGQIYAQYQGVNIQEVKDYANPQKLSPESAVVAAELTLAREDLFPIKSFANFDVDPLSGITATLSKLSDTAQVWVQVMVRPENDTWRNRALKYITAVRTGQTDFRSGLIKGLKSLASDVVSTAISGQAKVVEPGKVELAPGVEDALKQIEEKSTKLGFQTKIRIVSVDITPEAARQHLDLLVGTFKQFNTTNLNGFAAKPITQPGGVLISQYASRAFNDVGVVLNVTELASIYHLPSNTVSTPHIVWAGSKKGEPPANLPLADEVPAQELTNMGTTNFRGSQEVFGIKIPDRRRHIYVIGKSGVGKSTLLQNMTLDDIKEGRGVGVVDPHGDYVDYVLERIPNERAADVILFDPSDSEFPVAFNVLEAENPKYKVVTASGVVSVFKKIFGESWGPRLEYWLSSAVLALLDYEGATLMMLPRLFTDDVFREEVIDKIQDPVIKSRWLTEYNTLDQRQRAETISPILNKVGQFLSSSLVRNIVAQPKSGFSLREVMDGKKILLVKLTKGLIGEDNAALLGAMIVTKLQLAAMSRADEADQEKRTDFFLYVDEFQNFATDSFAVILSEARKYRLSLTLANQYMAQLPDTVKNAIFGNVGTIVSFRVGGDDAPGLVKEFAPVFDEQDLVNLSVFNIYIKLSIDGLTAGAFSAVTLAPTAETSGNRGQIMETSRRLYSQSIASVEGKVMSDTKTALERAVNAPPPQSRFGGGGQGYQRRPGGGGGSGGGGRPSVSGAVPQRQQVVPQVDALKNLISGVEKKSAKVLSPTERDNVAKTLMDDLKGMGESSCKAAVDRAGEPEGTEGSGSSVAPPAPPANSGETKPGTSESPE